LECLLGQLFEQYSRLPDQRTRDPAVTPSLPFAEEGFEELVQEASAFERCARVLVVRFLFQAQDVGREELKRALQIALDAADADARQHPRSGFTLKQRTVASAVRDSRLRPPCRGWCQVVECRRSRDETFVGKD